MPVPTIQWKGDIDGCCEMIDQTLLPVEYKVIEVNDIHAMWHAIKVLKVRGAPAIGIAGAFGIVLGVQDIPEDAPMTQFNEKLNEACEYLASSRPTAVNLFWAIDRMKIRAKDAQAVEITELKQILLTEAKAIRDEDAAMCRAIGANGKGLIKDGFNLLTHCNAGGLATADYGTALAPMFAAHEAEMKFHVYADETRPLLQGSRLTAWELQKEGIDATVICDNMAGYLMSLGKIDLVIVGADRIAANGDAANKIGTYSVAVLAKAHNIPFYVAAPSSTFDLAIADGSEIPIEQRDAKEISHGFGSQTAPDGIKVFNPAFDVTPAKLIAGIITEKGIISPVNTENIRSTIQP